MAFDIVVAIISHSNHLALRDCLTALAPERSQRAYSVGITVLDNASRDASAEFVRSRFPQVHLISQSARAGFGANHNTIIRATESRYVLILNDDTIVTPETVDTLAAFLDANPQVAAVGPRVVTPAGELTESAWKLPSPIVTLKFGLTLGRWRSAQCGNRRRQVGYLSGCALMLRRSALEDGNAFDESFFMYLEDADLCKRLGDAGHEVWRNPRATVTHSGGMSVRDYPHERINEEWRSRRYYWRKHHGRVAGSVIAGMHGTAYAGGLLILTMVRMFPGRWRSLFDRWSREELALHLRNAVRGPAGLGLRELAERQNRALERHRP